MVQLQGEEVKITDRISHPYEDKFYPPRLLSNKSNYTVFNFSAGVHYIVNSEGKFVKKLSAEDFSDLNTTQFNGIKNFVYEFHDDNQLVFNKIYPNNKYYKLDSKDFTFTANPAFDFLKNKIMHWSEMNNNYFFVYEQKEEISQLQIYDPNNNYTLIETIDTDDFDVFTYRDLDKEILLLHGNTIDRIVFDQNKIKTYLHDQSIRTIKEISEDTYIVATDNKGVYELNTKTGRTNKIRFIYKGKEVFITQPRQIFETKDGYIFNDKTNLYEVNKNYEIQNKYSHTLWNEVPFLFKDTIYKGGVNHFGIHRFSLKSKSYHFLEKAIKVREFETDGETLFGVSVNQGLFEYKNGNFTFYFPEEEEPNNFLSIYYHHYFGLLISTKQGKIYSFNIEKKTFKLFYEDSLKASIVGMIADDDNNLWMNTYAGITSYKPSTQIKNRYTKKDGVYELEGNRYSTYKDSRGNIFIGSYKGLSLFNPKELDNFENELKLQFTELSFFDEQEEVWKTHKEPKFLNAVQEISLPSYNQRFSAKVSFLDIVNTKNYKYRYRLVKETTKDVTDWNNLYLENEIIFSNLSAGTYTLQVEVLSNINKKIGETLELKIISKEIFYKTWWFALIVLTIIIGFFSYLFYQFKIRQRLYAANEIAINEAMVKEAMMLEIHHRIKNNLQVVSGLLSLQAFNSTDQELISKLQESQGRIDSIAGIHSILYKGDSREDVMVEEYFEDIISYNKTLFSKKVHYQLNMDTIKLPMDTAMPLALILNELINNSHKHAFNLIDNPIIFVEFKVSNTHLEFRYADNGNFKEKNEDRVSMGMKIVSMMVTQLKGSVEYNKEESFQMKLRFKKIRKE